MVYLYPLHSQFSRSKKLGGNFWPQNKILTQPPKFPADTLPVSRAPAPLSWETLPPLIGLKKKTLPPPPPDASESRTPPSPPPSRNIRNVHQGRLVSSIHAFTWQSLANASHFHSIPCVSKQCPADGVWRIGRGGSPDRVLKTRFTPSESSAGHGLPPQRAPKQCPAQGVWRVL